MSDQATPAANERQNQFLSGFYPNARMDTYLGTGVERDHPCAVRFDGERIKVEYLNYGSPCSYSGRATGEGHYELSAEGFSGKGTLHCMPGTVILEGFWLEGAYDGMWRIKLGERHG